MTLELAGQDLGAELAHALLDAARELERLARRGVITDECRSFPSDAALEHASPGYGARRRRLYAAVQVLALDVFHDGTALLPTLTLLRASAARVLSDAGVRHPIQQLILAEISTACVAASHGAARAP